MRPAASLILFTVLSGAGLGAIVWIGLGFGGAGRGTALRLTGGALAFAAIGLVSSVFHLKRPDRAWRALSQWRSSWLSREGILAIAALAVTAAYGAAWVLGGARLAPLGWAAAGLALATVFATSMIYAQIRAVPAWASALTPACFLAFALASGLVLAGALDGAPPRWAALVALTLLALAWMLRGFSWARTAGLEPPDRGAATALGGIGAVRPLEPPSTGPNYVTEEMVFRVGRTRARALKRLALILGLGVPAVALLGATAGGPPAAALWAVALAGVLGGLACERWLFFAEARHVVSAYF